MVQPLYMRLTLTSNHLKEIVFWTASLTLTLWSGHAHALEFFSGTLIAKPNGNFYLLASVAPTNQKTSFRIVPKTALLAEDLRKLSTGDFLSGGFEYDATDRSYSLQQIESVGLKSLLGPWFSTGMLFNFESFTRLSIIANDTPSRSFAPLSSNAANGNSSRLSPKQFNYSLTPTADSEEWVAFLSDNESTHYSTIERGANVIHIRLYDSDSGAVVQTFTLSRLNGLRKNSSIKATTENR